MSVRTSRGIPMIGLMVLVLCPALGVGQALAQDASGQGADAGAKTTADAPRTRSKARREGEYGGAVPGKGPVDKHRQKNALSWIGFQPRGSGGARVFLRLANELPYEQSVEGRVLTVHLEGARYRKRNTQRRLDVRFFGTVLEEITSKRVSRRARRGDRPARKAGIEVRLEFKEGVKASRAQASVKTEEDGYTYLYLDFDAPADPGQGEPE